MNIQHLLGQVATRLRELLDEDASEQKPMMTTIRHQVSPQADLIRTMLISEDFGIFSNEFVAAVSDDESLLVLLDGEFDAFAADDDNGNSRAIALYYPNKYYN